MERLTLISVLCLAPFASASPPEPAISHTMQTRNLAACSAAFSADGTKLAIGSVDGVVETWDVRAASRLSHFEFSSGAINDLAFRSDGRLTIVAGGRMYRVSPVSRRHTKLADWDEPGTLQLVRGGDTLVSNQFGKVMVIDVGTGRSRPVAGDWEASRAWERRKAIVLGSGPKLCVVDVRSLKVTHTARLAFSPPERVQVVATSPTDDTVFVGTTAGSIFRWDLSRAPKRIASLDLDPIALAVGPNNRRVVASNGSLVLDGETGAVVHRFEQPWNMSLVVFSPDGRAFVTEQPNGAILYDVVTGKALKTFNLTKRRSNG